MSNERDGGVKTRRIAIIGLGNSLLSDDAVGLHVASRCAGDLHSWDLPPDVAVDISEEEAGGWEIIDHAADHDALVLVDATLDSQLAPGEYGWIPVGTFTSPRLSGVHNMDVFSALAFARKSGMCVPGEQDVHVLGIGVAEVQTFCEECTPRVAAAVPRAAAEIYARVRVIVDA